MNTDIDRVESQLALIRERVARLTSMRVRSTDLGAATPIEEASRLGKVSAHWGIAPSWPVAGRIEVLGKRVMRILLRWYINPIVDQQNEFNAAVLRCFYELESRVDALEDELHTLRDSGKRTDDTVT